MRNSDTCVQSIREEGCIEGGQREDKVTDDYVSKRDVTFATWLT